MDMQTVTLGARPLPGELERDVELFAIGDVHGQADVLSAVLDQISAIPRIPGSRREIIFLGDLIDRGSDSLGAVALAMTSAKSASADRTVFLPGNHELMLHDVLEGGDPNLWLLNGGRTVMDEVDPDWRSLPWDAALRSLRTALPRRWIESIATAPSHLTAGDLLFVHAGVDPQADRVAFLDRHRPMGELHWATIRHAFLTWDEGWDRGDAGEAVRGPTVIVHGHTPAIRSSLWETRAELSQMDGIDGFRAICLDAGATSRPQIGWARFWREDRRSMVEISATHRGQS